MQTYSGTGVANPLGRIDVSGTHLLIVMGVDVNGTYGFVDGDAIYTTRDGSTITSTYSGTFHHDELGHSLFTAFCVLGEGTGRLEGVTGTTETDVVATGRQPGAPFTWTTHGKVTFPGQPGK
jgi:hypothetical protein